MKYGVSNHYKDERGLDYFAYQNRYAALRAELKYKRFRKHISKESRVLDFGCGGGWILSQADCALKVGVEVNKSAHEIARSNGLTVYDRIDSVKEKEFDVIISCHCLEHVPYPIEALSSLSRLLKSGGKLVLVVPIDDWRSQKKFVENDIDHHLHTWTPRLLANTLLDAGYSIETLSIFPRQWFPKWNYFIGWLPKCLFGMFCIFWGWIGRQREIVATATTK